MSLWHKRLENYAEAWYILYSEILKTEAFFMIITLGRQHGSNGHDIARALADALGYTCYDKEIVDHAAENSSFTVLTREDGICPIVRTPGFQKTPTSVTTMIAARLPGMNFAAFFG